MQGIGGDDCVLSDAQLGEQRPGGRDLVRFLTDPDMGEHSPGVGGEGAEQMSRGAIMEPVETTAPGLAVEGDAGRTGLGLGRLQPCRVAPERGLRRARIEPLEDVADRRVRGRAPSFQAEAAVQPAAMDVDEGGYAAIRVAAADNRQDREQQDMRQLVELAFRATRIGDLCQDIKQRAERGHDDLRVGCLPKNPKSCRSGIPMLAGKSVLATALGIALTPAEKSALNSPGIGAAFAGEHPSCSPALCRLPKPRFPSRRCLTGDRYCSTRNDQSRVRK